MIRVGFRIAARGFGFFTLYEFCGESPDIGESLIGHNASRFRAYVARDLEINID